MELKLNNGDYVPDGCGGFVRATGTQGLLAEALFRLTARRGAFPLLPVLGSRLHTLGREKRGAQAAAARQWAMEALGDLPLTVTGVTVSELAGELLQVHVAMQLEEESALLEVTI